MWSYTSPISTRRLSVCLVHKASPQLDLPFIVVPLRLAWFWVSNYMSHIVGAFLATGILKLRGAGGHAGWRYLFLIEGGFTLIIGLLSYFLMPAGPTQTRTWFRPNGWFTERWEFSCASLWYRSHVDVIREEVIMINRYVFPFQYSTLRFTMVSGFFVTTLPSLTCTIVKASPWKRYGLSLRTGGCGLFTSLDWPSWVCLRVVCWYSGTDLICSSHHSTSNILNSLSPSSRLHHHPG